MITPSRRALLSGGGLAAVGACAGLPDPAPGPFRPAWESLAAGYRAPDWFREAKFGIWSHWGPQCVPEFGDWYGRQMYMQGNPFYEHHLRTRGHPTRTGFIDIIGDWKAEAFDPEDLLDRFEAAGARYVVSMANHHDNLDMFPSTVHGWNTTRVGPMRDIVGTWAEAVRRRGLRFGVSNHGAHAWHWWQTAYGYDPEGPLAGVRYDAARLTRADGAGTFWEGLDPQELYTGPTFMPPDGITSIAEMNAWRDANDGRWIETIPANNPAFVRSWVARQRELVDRYNPDLVYFDNYGLPLEHHGLEATAYLYNRGLALNGELPVVNGKRLEPFQRPALVESVERGFSDVMRPEPWQTDTCIGDWHYNRARFEQNYYVPANSVVQRLVDVVSKNGNLLLSIPQRGDGSIDDTEKRILADIAAWMQVGGEAIFGSRPWRVFGEGPTRQQAGMHGEGQARPWTAEDIRYTTRGATLYAFVLDWPADNRVVLREPARGPGRIERVSLLGGGPIPFSVTPAGLEVTLPATRPTAFVPALRLEGPGLTG